MDLGLAGLPALVTGSSGGLGSAIAEQLAAEGCDVLVHGRNGEAAAAVAERISRAGGRAEVVTGDLTRDDDAVGVAAAAINFGVRILVNNAGPLAEHDWDSARTADWLSTLNGNVVSAVRVSTALLPSLRANGWGRVINIGSRAATTPLPHLAEYSAAKAAVVNMTTSLARHLAGTGVTANCVSPGVVVTPTMQRMFQDQARAAGEDPQWSQLEPVITARYASNPVGRLGRPTDVAAAVAFLASPVADYINGIDLRVDGGITNTP